nr:MAG TPA: hypothetical protein [Caudoviricetes sp.]
MYTKSLTGGYFLCQKGGCTVEKTKKPQTHALYGCGLHLQ